MADTDTFDNRFSAATDENKRLSDDDIDYLFGRPRPGATPPGPVKNPAGDIVHPSIPGIHSVETGGGQEGFPSGLWGGAANAIQSFQAPDWWKRATTPYKVPPMPDVSGPGDIIRDLTTGRDNPVEKAFPTPDKGHLSSPPTRTDAPPGADMPVPAPAPAPFGAGAQPPVGGVAGGLTPGGPTFPTFQRPPLPAPTPAPQPAEAAPPPAAAQPSPAPAGPSPGAVGATPGGSPQVPSKDTSLLPPGSLADIMHKWTSWRDENRLMLLAMAGGLAGSQSIGQGLGRAFSAAVPAAQADMARGNANATADILMSKIPNLSREQAVAMARNPEIMKQVIPQLFGEQRQHVSIKDADGNERLLSFDPRTGQYFDMQGHPMGQGGGQALPGTPDYNLTGEEFLKTVTDPAKAALIRKAASGELQLSPRQLATPQGMAFAKQVTAYDPSWVPQEAQNRQKAYSYWYAGGTGDKTVKALDQAADHMSGLPALIEGVPRGAGILDNPLINQGYNTGRYYAGASTTQPLVTRAHAVADELSGLWKGTQTDHEIQAWSKAFPVNGSKQQQKDAVKELIHLVNGGINSLDQQHERDFGRASARLKQERPIVSAQTAAKLEELRKYANDEGPGAGEARPAELPRITSKAEFDALPKGAHFLDEHGKPWVK